MVKITITLLFILTCSLSSIAQETFEEIFTVVEQKPEFPGGEAERIRYLSQNINYPYEARVEGITGTVYVTFVIEKSGSVSDVRIIRGIGGGCDEEVVRLVKSMPNWMPGVQRGKPVRVQYTMPVKFNLATPEEIENYQAILASDTIYNPEDDIFTVVEDSPEFPGGSEALNKFLEKNIEYPELARQNEIQGTVYATFVVEKSGKVNHVRILRGIGGGCDEEAMRVVKLMPKWKAGKQRGKPVRVQFNLPMKFSLKRVYN